MTTDENLEDKVFYRVVKVLYFIALVYVFGKTIITINDAYWDPKLGQVNTSTSMIICDNGSKYHFNEVYRGLELKVDRAKSGTFDQISDLFAKNICYFGYIDDNKGLENNLPRNYSLELYYTHDIVFYFIVCLILFFFICAYIVLNLIRETLIYIMYGKKISWTWLRRIRIFN